MLDARVRRVGALGEVLLGGEPFRLVRLSAAGANVLDALVAGISAGGRTPASDRLVARLVAGGLLHPQPAPRPLTGGEVAVVVPVRDDYGRLARLLHALRRDFPGEILVVDDGSAPEAAERIREVTVRLGGTLHRRQESGGPAAARNEAAAVLAGASPEGSPDDTAPAQADGRDGGGASPDETAPAPFIAFVDADVVPEPGWLEGLAGHFDDPLVGAVAPRVHTRNGVGRIGGALAAYDWVCSPLDLGPAPGAVGAHRRIAYVPSAAIVCRRRALDDVGWFEPAMRVGEDVDLGRRMEKAGWSIRYEPRVGVWHEARGGFLGFGKQRFSYGTSAADLERRHPGTVAPFEATWWGLLAGAGAIAVGGRALGRIWDTCVPCVTASRRTGAGARRGGDIAAAGAAVTWVVATAIPVRRLRAMLAGAGVGAPTRTAVAVVMQSELGTARGLATATRRVWWPALLVVAVLVPPLRRPLVAVTAVSELAGSLPAWRKGKRMRRADTPSAGLGATVAIGVLDDAAYGAGVWAGCLRWRSGRALLPRLARGQPSSDA